MDKVGVLCEKDSAMMHAFSRLSLDIAGGRSLLSVAFSLFSSYLEANIKKEVAKDKLIIEEAAAAFAAGVPACDLDLEDFFEKTKLIDRNFLNKLMIPSFAVTVRYSDIAEARIQRIWVIAKNVHYLLGEWPESASFADAARNAYTDQELRAIICEILHLYSIETRLLGETIRSPFPKATHASVEVLFHAMEEAKEELSNDYIGKLYGTAAHQAGC